MYGFLLRPRWVGFHLLVVGGIIAMVNLGFWQLRRLDERQDFNATVESRYDADVVPLDELLTPGSDPADLAWRPVSAAGSYLDGETIFVVNRSQNGRAGQNVVDALQLDDGRVLLVNRGFVPLAEPTIPPVPADDVAITGRLRPSQERRFGQLSDPADGVLREAQRLDLNRLAAQFDGELVPMYVDLIESTPAETGPFPEPVATPDLSEGNHLSYAVQWFIFSIAVAVGWVLAVRRSVRSRQRALDSEPDSPSEHPDMAQREPATN